jgi:hypothetical protein
MRAVTLGVHALTQFRMPLETDWPVGVAGFEPLHSGIEIRQDSSLGRRDSNLCILESEFAKTLSRGARLELALLELKARPDRRLKPVEAG